MRDYIVYVLDFFLIVFRDDPSRSVGTAADIARRIFHTFFISEKIESRPSKRARSLNIFFSYMRVNTRGERLRNRMIIFFFFCMGTGVKIEPYVLDGKLILRGQ